MPPNQIFNDDYFDRTYGSALLKGSHPFLHCYWIRYLHKIKTDGRLLDVGCGLGFFVEKASKYYECTGIDVSEYAISFAKKRITKVIFTTGDANSLAFKEDHFDIITSFDVCEHLKHPEKAIREFKRILKNQGILIISVPNTESIGVKWKGKDWFGNRDSTHESLLSPGNWQDMLTENGFRIIDIRHDGLWDAPYFKRIPNFIQYFYFTIPSMILFWLGFRIPNRLSENIILVSESSDPPNKSP